MHLPSSNNLPVDKLASAFRNTSSIYKFYWLLAIIETVEHGSIAISKRELFSKMIANAWYTINYFHISFGKQDVIQNAAKSILVYEQFTIDTKREEISKRLQLSNNTNTLKTLNHFDKNVPHWFLSPWFNELKSQSDTNYKKLIYTQSQQFYNDCLYALYDEYIQINKKWISYIRNNAKILKDFCFWNLSLFLQVRNPNVPDISGKLFKPPFRNSLTNYRKNYWDIVFKEIGTIDCIFTDTKLNVNKYALDHFIPHAFVSHDLIWNLLPIDNNYNSFKSDKLPSIEKHFKKFYNIQKVAFEIIKYKNPSNKILDEYITLFPTLDDLSTLPYLKFKENIQPLITIANNNGFIYLDS